MILTVILRISAATNMKVRPEWYSKALCARSLLLAVQAVPIETEFYSVVDGEMPPECEQYLRPHSTIQTINGGNNRKSFLAALELAEVRSRLGQRLIWFCEDDYLYEVESLSRLVKAAMSPQFSDVDYYTIYKPRDEEWHRSRRSQPLRTLLSPLDWIAPDGLAWASTTHATSTFGARSEALLEDASVIRSAIYAGGPFAHSTSAVLQGVLPFAWPWIWRDLNLAANPRALAQGLLRVPTRVFANLAALRVKGRRRALAAPAVDLAVHAESDQILEAGRWSRLAADIQASIGS